MIFLKIFYENRVFQKFSEQCNFLQIISKNVLFFLMYSRMNFFQKFLLKLFFFEKKEFNFLNIVWKWFFFFWKNSRGFLKWQRHFLKKFQKFEHFSLYWSYCHFFFAELCDFFKNILKNLDLFISKEKMSEERRLFKK